MKKLNTQYFFAAAFMTIGIIQMFRADVLESSLYILAGLAFTFNLLASEERFRRQKKVLVAVTWTLMIATGLLFLWVLQFHYL